MLCDLSFFLFVLIQFRLSFLADNSFNWQIPETPYAIAILTVEPDLTVFRWTRQLPHDEYTVFFVADSINENAIVPVENTTNIFIVHLNAHTLINRGYQNASIITMPDKPVMAWDKVIFLFAEIFTKHQFMWILEDDVFIPSVNVIHQLTANSHAAQSDLTVKGIYPSHPTHPGRDHPWHWEKIYFPHYSPPYYFSLVCMMGASARLFSAIKHFVMRYHRLEFVETLFHTVAAKESMKILIAPELASMSYQSNFLTCQMIQQAPNHVFHPMKNPRQFIGNCVLQNEWFHANQENATTSRKCSRKKRSIRQQHLRKQPHH